MAGNEDRRSSTTAGELEPDQALWQRFAQAATSAAFCESWLALLSGMLENVRSGVVLLGAPDKGPFAPAGVWPHAAFSIKHLIPAAERALRERHGLILRPSSTEENTVSAGSVQIAYPLEISGKVHGVVVLELSDRDAREIPAAMRKIHWGAAWLEVMLRRAEAVRFAEAADRQQRLLDLLATALEYEHFQPAVLTFATRLATALECDRASLGFKKRNRMRIRALSHSAEFAKRMNVVRALEAAMDEAADQRAIVVYPPPEGAPTLVVREHASLAQEQGAAAVCTVPLEQKDAIFGAITLERTSGKAFDEDTVELIRTIASMAGPILEGKRKEDRLLIQKVAESGVLQLKKLIGPGHLALKTCTIVAVLLVLFFTFAKGEYRVTAPTSLEGTVQRVISAPFNGYVADAPSRPGDVVHEGDLLARLDDRDIRLERLKWATQEEELQVQYSEALAKHDRAQVGITQAKIDQAKAQIDLLDEQLSRSRVVAPFDGVITSGDFSQFLGTPVERGQGLFEVAPLGGYRVILQVDERDIAQVKENQKGELVLPSLPGQNFPLTVSQITPVSVQKEGRNYFRAEAKLGEHSERLRPGMEGVGKISIDRRRLIWIWTHEITEWISLKLWTWWP